MIHVTDSGHAPGTIIVAAGATPRFYEFQMALDQVLAPAGTKLLIVRGCDITKNFNDGIKRMTGEWAWFLGDDHAFDRDVLMRLLAHQVEVIAPIIPCKSLPFPPCVLHGPKNGDSWHENMPFYRWEELSGDGVLILPYGDFTGQAGMLAKKSVLDTLGYPWFKCGQFDPGRLHEDLYFCHEMQQAGYDVHIDQDMVLDHYTAAGVTARKQHGVWTTAVQFEQDALVLQEHEVSA